MFDHVIIGQYVSSNSFIHRLDARAKLLCLIVFIAILFVYRHPFVMASASILLVIAFILARIPIIYYLKGLRFVVLMITFTFLFHALFQGGDILLLETPIANVYLEGLIEGGYFALRLLMIFIFASLLSLTTTPVELTDGLEKLLSPLKKLKLPIHELAFMMGISMRFIPILSDEAEKIIKAQTARGAHFSSGSLWKRLTAFIPIFIPLFVRALNRAEEVAIAMEARGYTGGEGRTKLRDMRWRQMDTASLSIFCCFLIVAIILRFS
ncbi:energy-coupling factor transporter transmembrane component T family protein [Evansella cellulosilytica]|uniref:Cobalt transport protein n=1 Tax=Evansella cellulosilytica (strain ATCC 21833 / DSM 2522 / FERM P-1141 / JCM 9156 / N-4) TaxID=649639 RepID=E6TTA4_EVAC2|nr:energy-coupling factor transporter transmembrane component T [Evansella cellulosilytica]ADU28444.1 cobalt transport protein [Evansella cellulosilytica DSM 2522]